MEQPVISVVIPVYNMERYLARCLDSVRQNTYRDLEILCVDDGSTDGSAQILRQYASEDSRFVVISKQNGGVSSARNAALDRMTGTLVTFIDPDDYVHPYYFELLYKALKAFPSADSSMCGFRFVWENGSPVQMEQLLERECRPRFVSSEVLFKSHAYRTYCGARLIRAEKIGSTRFREDLSYSEDSIFIAELAERGDGLSCAVLPDTLYYYCQREDSLVKRVNLRGRMKATQVLADKALQSPANETIYLDQAVRRCLTVRYLAGGIPADRAIVRECDHDLKALRKRFAHTSVYSRKNKMLYALYIAFPGMYWAYRSFKEPYMLRMRRAQRDARRSEKRQSGRDTTSGQQESKVEETKCF